MTEREGGITVLGLGLCPEDRGEGTRRILKKALIVVLQTERCEAAAELRASGIPYRSLDSLYESNADFEAFCRSAAAQLLSWARENENSLCFAVPGSPEGLPLLVELKRQADEKGVPVKVLPALGYGDAALARHMGDPGFEEQAVRCFASSLPRLDWQRPLCVQELDNVLLAGQVKLALLDVYPEMLTVYLSQCCDGVFLEREISLYELDRQGQEGYDHSSCLLLPALDFDQLNRYGMGDLYHILHRLRGPGGCPWDAEQNHASLRSGLLEEAYEVADAIDAEDDDALCEELGDLLLQVYFHALIAEEHGSFGYHDVSTGISNKMIHRHPHVFAGEKVKDAGEVLERWEDIKRREKQQQRVSDTLAAVPKAFPALMRAAKLQKRAAKVGFDWEELAGALDKVAEEREEWLTEWRQRQAGAGCADRLEMEMGDWLFSLVNIARMAEIDPERALQRSNEKFCQRFLQMECLLEAKGLSFESVDLDTMNEYWEMAKSMQDA